MRIFLFGLAAISSTAFGESQYALVDSINLQSGNSFLSFDVGDQGEYYENVTLQGSMWHQEISKFKDIEVTVTQEAQNQVEDTGETIVVGNVTYRTHERVLVAQQSKIVRKMLITDDGSTMLGLSDDPGPLAIAAILAGSAVSLCTAKIVFDLYQCEKPRLTIGFGPTGFECDARCE